jgi:hypothetical protein
VLGEGLTFKARQDWPVSSGKTPTRPYSTVQMAFRGTGGSIVFGQADNPNQLPLVAFAKTPATAGGSPHGERSQPSTPKDVTEQHG